MDDVELMQVYHMAFGKVVVKNQLWMVIPASTWMKEMLYIYIRDVARIPDALRFWIIMWCQDLLGVLDV